MPQIRHIALLTNDPPKLAEFYRNSFDMKEVARSGEKQDAIYLSDGHINLAILPARGRPEGIYHFGFEVANVEKAMHDAIEAGATKGTDSLPRDGRFAEGFIRDPVGTRVDLSLGWKI